MFTCEPSIVDSEGWSVGAGLRQRRVEERVRVDVTERGRDRFGDAGMSRPQAGQELADLAPHALLFATHASDRGEAARTCVRRRQILRHEREGPQAAQSDVALPRGGWPRCARL